MKVEVLRDLLGRAHPAHAIRIPGMSNTYVLGKKRLVVIDPGAASSAKAVMEFITQDLGRKLADIGLIVVTHLHCDHIGGVAELAGATGAPIAMAKSARDYVEGRKTMRWAPVHRWIEMLQLYRGTGYQLPSLKDVWRMPWAGSPLSRQHALPFKVTRWLREGESIVAGQDWRVLESPGHTEDSICLHEPSAGALVSGDVILGMRNGGPRFNPFFAWDETQEATERKLRRLKLKRVLPGHGPPVTGRRNVEITGGIV